MPDCTHAPLVTTSIFAWVVWMRVPKSLIVDGGANSSSAAKMGDDAQSLRGKYNYCTGDSHHLVGRAVRQVRTVNFAYQSIDGSVGAQSAIAEKLLMGVLAHNIHRSISSISPTIRVFQYGVI